MEYSRHFDCGSQLDLISATIVKPANLESGATYETDAKAPEVNF